MTMLIMVERSCLLVALAPVRHIDSVRQNKLEQKENIHLKKISPCRLTMVLPPPFADTPVLPRFTAGPMGEV